MYRVWFGNRRVSYQGYTLRELMTRIRKEDDFREYDIDVYTSDGLLLAYKKAGNKNFCWRRYRA